MKRTIKKSAILISSILLIGISSYALAGMGGGSHMGGYGTNNTHMNGSNGYGGHHMNGNYEQGYGNHMDNGRYMHNTEHFGGNDSMRNGYRNNRNQRNGHQFDSNGYNERSRRNQKNEGMTRR